MLACAESDSEWSQIVIHEYLCENELLSKTILACLSGTQMALIHEIKKTNKSAFL